jgi:hypothetical protein
MLNLVEQSDAAFLRPPAPTPPAKPLGLFGLLKSLWKNPLEAWTEAHFERPVVTTHLPIGQITVVSDPNAIRRVLQETVPTTERIPSSDG